MSAPPESSARAEPYGFWPSDFSAADAVAASADYADLVCDETRVLWVETNPSLGRSLIMEWTAGHLRCLTPEGFSVRSRVFEYGGGALCLLGDLIAFVNDTDQQLYLQTLEGGCSALTSYPDCRYGGLVGDSKRSRIIAVEERREICGKELAVAHRLVAIDTAGQRVVLAEGADFYASPVLTKDGGELAWIEWNRPELPWTRTRLCRAKLNEAGELVDRQVAGSDESLQQPVYDEQGRLFCLSDQSGYWTPWLLDADGILIPLPAETADHAPAPWTQSPRHLVALPDGRLALSWLHSGFGYLAVGAVNGGPRVRLAPEYTRFRSLAASSRYLYCVAGSPRRTAAVLRIDLADGQVLVLSATPESIPPEQLSLPQPLSYPTGSGETAHGFFYPPCNASVKAPEGAPPLIILLHGGPTSACYPVLDNRIQFWTQRGFAVADLNYRGSVGYGRAYRERLRGHWGEIDVEDCVKAIDHLAEAGLVDAQRVFIRGASAGGFTALCALVDGGSRFRAAASLYGVSDLLRLRASTHKFEADYVDWLVGDPVQVPHRYRQRSALHQIARIATPVIFFQGSEDRVVPPDQTERMVAALRANGTPVTHISFEGERHGFGRKENLARVLEEELAFYREWLG
ncbi:alpha/beta hydrolase family protein [Pseudomonas sp.]|uniref:alpha/beta hydrolase family protein n=1 Tax=Pseudomonas sp. TaxID=306 RepID=UPI002729E18E|nr:S9 family peptidase [Pseudomonas sp.]